MRDGRLARPAWQTVQRTGGVVPLLQDATELRTGAGPVPQRTLISTRKADLEGFGALRLGHEADEPLSLLGKTSRSSLDSVSNGSIASVTFPRVKHWRVYAEEGLARCKVAVWLGDGEMALEHGGRTLSRYDVSLSREAKLKTVTNPRLFSTLYGAAAQPKLFALEDALGEGGWLKALRLDGYAARNRRRPEALQHPLFPYLEAP